MVQRNVDGIRSMVLNILHYAKEREIYWQAIDLVEVTSAVQETLARRAEILSVELEVKAEPGFFDGDRHSVHSLLVTLIENSIDACRVDRGKSEHRVTLSAAIVDQQVVFEVADNGIGMDRETADKAFSLFFSAKGAEGTGLGLFIANKIAKGHGGNIAIDSSPGVGTRMVVKLPKTRPEQSSSSREAHAKNG